VARPAPPSDDGSPARLIATMVGIVGILLLGSLAWSAVGALVSAVGAASSALSSANAAPTLVPVVAVTPASEPTHVPTLETPAPTRAATDTPREATPTGVPAATPTSVAATPTSVAPTPTLPAATPTGVATGRNPWILLPLPEPGTRVQPGQVVIEARGRGDAPIKAMRLELDGAALPVAMEQRSDSTWRGSANARVAAGQHDVRASVTDAEGRSGSYRWSFSAAPAP
jgi:hypothetical protein